MGHIDIAEAKKQIQRISKELKEPLLLIGGIAVNQYNAIRQSQDIDLICDYNMATKLVDKLYKRTEWTVKEINQDEYRPSYHIKHKTKIEYPIIKIGPKITERGAYKYLDWEKLKEEAIPFEHNNKKHINILVPSIEALCYSKLVSFIGRKESDKEKLSQDLRDICELTNCDSFRLGVLLNFIVSNSFDAEMIGNFQSRLNFIDGSLDESSLGLIIKLFSKKVENKTEMVPPFQAMLQPRPRYVEPKKRIQLAAFDLDGTLIKGIRHSWTIVWNHLKADNNKQKLNKAAFRGKELSYLEWCRLDSEAFIEHGLEKSHFVEIVKQHNLGLTKNLREGLIELKRNGIRTAIISGGIDSLLYELLPDADELFDEILINRFIYAKNGRLENISATEYDWDDSKIGVVGKRRGLERICEKYDIAIEDASFAGDDLNDIEAMKSAGLKIFYCADTREFVENDHLPEEIVLIPENDFLKVVARILNAPIGEQID